MVLIGYIFVGEKKGLKMILMMTKSNKYFVNIILNTATSLSLSSGNKATD